MTTWQEDYVRAQCRPSAASQVPLLNVLWVPPGGGFGFSTALILWLSLFFPVGDGQQMDFSARN